jgi:hypothetical protein
VRAVKDKFSNGSHCFLESRMIESKPFLELSGKAAMLVLIRFQQKLHRKKDKGKKTWTVTNSKELIFTYAEAKELGIRSTRTFYKVIRELVEDKGFLDISKQGNWYHRQPTKYAISDRWRHYGTDAYKRVEIPRALPEGMGF